MKLHGKRILFLSLLLFVCLSFSAGASPEQTKYYTIPDALAYMDCADLYPGENGAFYLLSSGQSGTRLCQISGTNGNISLLLEDSLPCTASCLRNGRLFIAYSTMDFSPEWGEFVRSTKIVLYVLQTGEQKSFWISDLFLSDSYSFTVDEEGCLYAFDRSQSNTLSIYTPDGIPTKSISLEEPLSSICCPPDCDRVYLSCSESSRFLSFSTKNPENLLECSSSSPFQPYRFLDGQAYVDSFGDLYVRDEHGFSQSFSTFCPEPLPTCDTDSLYCLPEGGPLLKLDRETGETLSEYPMSIDNPQALEQSGNYCAVLGREGEHWRIGVAALSSPQPVNPSVYSPQPGSLSASQIQDAWKSCLPQNTEIDQVYSISTDWIHFSTPGSLSSQALADGMYAANFYRAIYGLPKMEVSEEECQLLQYGAVLSLLQPDAGLPSRPANMDEAFYQHALTAKGRSFSAFLPGPSAYPAAQAVHLQMAQSPSFRSNLLCQDNTHVALGAAQAEDLTTVLIDPGPQQNPSIVSYPPPGVFPLDLLQQSDWWSVELGDLVAGLRGPVWVMVTDTDTGQQTIRRQGEELTVSDGHLSWRSPSLLQEHSYQVTINGLCTQSGHPAQIQFSTVLFAMDISLPTPSDDPTPPSGKGQIESDLYHIDRFSSVLSGVVPSTSLSAFKKGLSGDGTLQIWKNGRMVTNGNIGTGMTIRLVKDQSILDELTVLITGDLTGEGNINTLDLRALCNHLLEEKRLEGLWETAADINRDGSVNTLDLLALSYYLSERYDIQQK